MLLRHLSRTKWESKLREIGAKPLEGAGPLNTAEWWKVDKPGGRPFTVPVDEAGRCEMWAFRRIYEAQGGPRLHGDPPKD